MSTKFVEIWVCVSACLCVLKGLATLNVSVGVDTCNGPYWTWSNEQDLNAWQRPQQGEGSEIIKWKLKWNMPFLFIWPITNNLDSMMQNMQPTVHAVQILQGHLHLHMRKEKVMFERFTWRYYKTQCKCHPVHGMPECNEIWGLTHTIKIRLQTNATKRHATASEKRFV